MAALTAVAFALLTAGKAGLGIWLYPKPPALPPSVTNSVPELLLRLEAGLKERAPEALAALQPGLSQAQLHELEQSSGLELTEELRQLYQWRNGMRADGLSQLAPGLRFLPLVEAVNARNASLKAGNSTGAAFIRHRIGWLQVMDDGAGDGYFYDPDRRGKAGSFFYSFAEEAHFQFFPSVANFVAGLAECFETGAYHLSDNRRDLEDDTARSALIWSKLSAER